MTDKHAERLDFGSCTLGLFATRAVASPGRCPNEDLVRVLGSGWIDNNSHNSSFEGQSGEAECGCNIQVLRKVLNRAARGPFKDHLRRLDRYQIDTLLAKTGHVAKRQRRLRGVDAHPSRSSAAAA
jgi:hypothetical protein